MEEEKGSVKRWTRRGENRRLRLSLSCMTFQHVHLIGIGGIQMSAVAKLLHRSGVSVTGSDVAKSPQTEELRNVGIPVSIGHDVANLPPITELVIYTSAVPELNVERAEARRRNLPQYTNFAFLGEWFQGREVVLVTGTHGKSTTTAMLGLLCERAGLDPTVIVGSKVPQFPDGNVRFGQSDLVLIEGDEYERHFLSFHPRGVVINNIELDHTDVFANVADILEAFRSLLGQIPDGGWVVANADDPQVSTLIGQERTRLASRHIHVVTFGCASHADVQMKDLMPTVEGWQFSLRDEQHIVTRLRLTIPGKMNVMNATAACVAARRLKAPYDALRETLAGFRGIWRRFEKVAERDGMTVISDYAHHPTAVVATIEAAKQAYPGRRIVVCFQPHHRHRTRHFFLDFIQAFDKADAVILVEIYDVAGREQVEDRDISSHDLCDALTRHDADRGCTRLREYAGTVVEARHGVQRIMRAGDVILIMGAGDIYTIAADLLSTV